MRAMMKKVWNDDTGNVLVILGATLPLFIGAAGLATDTIQWSLWKRQLQRAADSAAIAGVYQRVQTDDQARVETAVDRDLDLNQNTGIELETGFPVVTRLTDDGDMTERVQVDLAVSRPLSFSGLFLKDPPQIRATATAASVPGTDDYCVVSLEDSAETGIKGSGNAGVWLDCGMITNSTAANSAIAKGSVTMEATVIASVGGIEKSDNWIVDKYDPYVRKMDDPYEGIDPDPSEMDCSQVKEVVQGGKNTTTTSAPVLDPDFEFGSSNNADGNPINCFSEIDVQPGETLNLPAGTYYVDGGDVKIQGAVTGTDVTIILTNSSSATNATIGEFDMNAGAELTISAPNTGKYAGIAVMQDRRAVDKKKQSPNKFNGGSTGTIVGALYFPNQGVTYNGDGNTTAVCTRFVTKRITFTGNSATTNKFTGNGCPSGVPTYQGGFLIRLVA